MLWFQEFHSFNSTMDTTKLEEFEKILQILKEFQFQYGYN